MDNKEWQDYAINNVVGIAEKLYKYDSFTFKRLESDTIYKLAVQIHQNIILEQSLQAGFTSSPNPLEMIAIQLGAREGGIGGNWKPNNSNDIDNDVEYAVDILKNALDQDKEFRQTYIANIAMCIVDEFEQGNNENLVESANKAAERFLNLFCS